MVRIMMASFILLTSGCASYHNLNKDGSNSLGGGFYDNEIHERFYYIVAKTNFAPWTNFSAAHKTFNRRAIELCNSSNYTIIDVNESEYEHVQTAGAAKYIISQVKGYVVCEPETMSVAAAKAYLQEHLK